MSCSSRGATSAQGRATAHAQTLHVTPPLTSRLVLQNCLRDVRAAIEMGKPLILVHEADPGKGGGTLQELRAECPEDLQADIFDKGWPMTVWHRINAYQIVSLTIIAEALLLQWTNKRVSLFMSDEQWVQSYTFSKPVLLWVSPANAGAEELANELAHGVTGCAVSTAEEAGDATHMLLYLNEHTFVSDERLAEQVKQARADRLPVMLVHENDPALGGCPFDYFFQTTPQELIAGLDGHAGLYKALAMSFFPGAHREARPPLAQSPPPTISR